MRYTAFLFLLMISLNACREPAIKDAFIIEGNVKIIPDGKVYLTEAHFWQIHLDSAECINGHFVFKRKTDSSFYPYLASIQFPDSNAPMKYNQLMFVNEFAGSGTKKSFFGGFYLEPGITRIAGIDSMKPPGKVGIPATVKAGRQNELFYRNHEFGFGWIKQPDEAKRLSRLAYFRNQIKKYPYGYYFLESIYNYKQDYSKQELRDLLALFDSDVQQSGLGNKVKTYLKNRPEADAPYPNLLLLDSKGQRDQIIDTSAALNMLVFWASWCKPCRMEIPSIKEIEKKYRGRELHLVSISIDDRNNNWVKALQEEKMVWPQYRVDADKLEQVKEQFNFYAIPLILFTDKAGKELARFKGYEEGAKSSYDAVISKYISPE